jgi:DNA-directed RNA polymerase specialized sigma subunit
MIKTEKEYIETKKRLKEDLKAIETQRKKMKQAGMNQEQIRVAIDPLSSFALQLKEEIEEYEKLKEGQFEALENLNGIGRLLIALRIFKGIKQKELAARLQIKESQLSRDERNEYHGASVEKVQRVLSALGVRLKSEIEIDFRDVG